MIYDEKDVMVAVRLGMFSGPRTKKNHRFKAVAEGVL